MKNLFRFLIFIALSLLLVGLDAGTKQLAIRVLGSGREITLLPGVLSFLYVENAGAAFGILHGQQWVFYIITTVVMLGLLYFVGRMPKGKRFRPLFLVSILIFAGAIGNLIDRVMKKYVVDFIYFKLIDFPVFNVADIYVTMGCLFMVLLFLFYYKDEELSFLNGRRH